MLGATIALAVPACSAADQPTDAPAVRSTPAGVEVAADLDLLLERLEAIHPEPFHGIERSEFVTAMHDLQSRLPELSPDQTTVEVMRLVGLLSRAGRDGHQFALPQPGHEGPALPLRVYEFAEGVFVTAAQPPYDDLVGTRIVAIEDRPIEDVLAAIEPLVPRDGPATVPAFRPIFLLRAEVLRGLGLATDEPIDVTVSDDSGERTVAPEPVPFEEYVTWAGGFGMLGLPDRADTRYLDDSADILRFETIQGGVYVRYREVRLPAFDVLESVRQVIAGADVKRFVLDIRQNPGGDNHNNTAIVDLLTDFRTAHPGGAIVVITDRVTFSAAANLATDLEAQFDPVYVGEPMGGGLNFWNDVTQIRLDGLPTPMQVGVSTRYWQRSVPDDPRLSIQPDVTLPVSAADYFAGHDPLWMLRSRARPDRVPSARRRPCRR